MRRFLQNHYLKMIRPGDIIVIISLFILSFLPLVIFSLHESQLVNNQAVTAYIKHDTKVVYSVRLDQHQGVDYYTFKDKSGHYNKIKITDHSIEMIEANCNDQLCIRRGKINKAGQTIVCLPHKLMIQIKSNTGDQSGGMVTA